jgi:hypothetical protein
MPDLPGMEFLVIGAQKAGTTTLWKLLRDHPELWLPDAKEAPFFSHTEVYERGWPSYLERLGVPVGEGVLRGTVTPHYMQGWRDAGTPTVAARIARLLPQARLVALLREPVARARSQHAMARARRHERRDADSALRESLHPSALRQGRLAPDDTNTYVVQGEYGRILGEYVSLFPRDALHVELSDSLSEDPRGVVRRVLRFLEVDDEYEPPAPFQRAFVGGRRPRSSEEDLMRLLRALDAARPAHGEQGAARDWLAERSLDPEGRREFEQIMSRYLQAPAEHWYPERVGLEFTLRKIWNVVPCSPEPISQDVRAELAAHYAADAPALAAATGLTAPWGGSG